MKSCLFLISYDGQMSCLDAGFPCTIYVVVFVDCKFIDDNRLNIQYVKDHVHVNKANFLLLFHVFRILNL